jgi:prepilin-type processing-associated H-X9-DG protein
LTDQGADAPTGTGLPSFFFDILPYLEQDYIYFVYSQTGPRGYYSHSSILVFTGTMKGTTPVQQWGGSANQFKRVYVDPADKTGPTELRDVSVMRPDGVTGYYATGSYAVNGLVFASNRAKLPDDFPDGTATTILIGERPQVCRSESGEPVYNLWGLGIYSPHMPAFATLTPDQPAGLWTTGQIAPVVPLPDPADVSHRIPVRVGRRNAVEQPPDFSRPFGVLRGFTQCDPRLPATPHRAGLNVAMADGSVRTFAPDTPEWLFWAACTPAGQEAQGPDWAR